MIETISADCAERYAAFYEAITILKDCTEATACAYDLDEGYLLVSLGGEFNKDRKVDRKVVDKLVSALDISLHKWAEEEDTCEKDCGCSCYDTFCDQFDAEAVSSSVKDTITQIKDYLKRIEDDMK